MAIAPGSIAEFTVSGGTFSQVWSNVYTYEVIVWPSGVTAEQAAEAYWDHIKATYRALLPVGWASAFQTITCKDLTNPTGDYAVYGIPSAERAGTRSNPSGHAMPPFLAVGARLNVGSRVTRPGQKRFTGLYEVDSNGDTVDSGFKATVEAILAVVVGGVVLGAPAATVSLDPVVVKRDPVDGSVLAHQLVTSYTVNELLTSQNTRKIGRGI
jgi:hypothetical protein